MKKIVLPYLLLLVVFSCKQPVKEPIVATLKNVPVQDFIIHADSNAIVKGKQGSKFLFPEGSLVDSSGNMVKGRVDISLIEINRIEDFVKSGVTTESDGNLLISDGSYFIEAKQNGGLLSVKKGKSIYASFPTRKKDAEMGFFIGEPVAGNVNWKEEKEQKTITTNTPPSLRPGEKEVLPKASGVPSTVQVSEGEHSALMAEYNDLSMYLHDNIYNEETPYVELGGWFIPEDEADRIVRSKYGMSYSEYRPSHYNSKEKKEEIESIVNPGNRPTAFRYRASIVKAREKRFKELNAQLGIGQPVKPASHTPEKKVKRKENETWESFIRREDEAYKKEFGTEAYLYALNKLGWVNCDKFVKETQIGYTGRILTKGGTPITSPIEVHLISRKEKIHLKKLVVDGTYTFTYPVDKSFDIVFVYGDEEVSKTFEGTATLENIIVQGEE